MCKKENSRRATRRAVDVGGRRKIGQLSDEDALAVAVEDSFLPPDFVSDLASDFVSDLAAPSLAAPSDEDLSLAADDVEADEPL